MKKIKHKRLEKCIFNRQQNDSGNKEGMELDMNIYDTANRLASEIKQYAASIEWRGGSLPPRPFCILGQFSYFKREIWRRRERDILFCNYM